MVEFVSEAISAKRGCANTAAMGRGEPGLPTAFTWRGDSYTVCEVLERWKQSSPEGGRAGNEVYLRRHYFRTRMSDGSLWTVYFLRQAARSGSAKTRWFLYEIDTDASSDAG